MKKPSTAATTGSTFPSAGLPSPKVKLIKAMTANGRIGVTKAALGSVCFFLTSVPGFLSSNFPKVFTRLTGTERSPPINPRSKANAEPPSSFPLGILMTIYAVVTVREMSAPGIKYFSTASAPNMPMPAAAPAKFRALPVVMPSRIRITASIGSTPALVIMGMAMEPIMMIAPRPVIPKKTKAVAAVIKVAKAMGLSPESSAAFLMMASEMFVF